METIPLLQSELGVLILIFITVLVLGLVFGIGTQNKLNKLNDNDNTLNGERVSMLIHKGALAPENFDTTSGLAPYKSSLVKLHNEHGRAYENLVVKMQVIDSGVIGTDPANTSLSGVNNVTFFATNSSDGSDVYLLANYITTSYSYQIKVSEGGLRSYNATFPVDASIASNFTYIGMMYKGDATTATNNFTNDTHIYLCGIDQDK